MSIRFSLESDEPALRALWKKTFGDSDDYLDLVFSRILSPQRSRPTTAAGSKNELLNRKLAGNAVNVKLSVLKQGA